MVGDAQLRTQLGVSPTGDMRNCSVLDVASRRLVMFSVVNLLRVACFFSLSLLRAFRSHVIKRNQGNQGWLFVVDHTGRGTPTAGRGTGFRDTLPRVSAAVAVARAVVPNSTDGERALCAKRR